MAHVVFAILLKQPTHCDVLFRDSHVSETRITHRHPPSAKGTTIKALSTKTVFVRCWETPTDSDSRNFTKHTREVTGKGESLEKNTDMLCKEYKQGEPTCLLQANLFFEFCVPRTIIIMDHRLYTLVHSLITR